MDFFVLVMIMHKITYKQPGAPGISSEMKEEINLVIFNKKNIDWVLSHQNLIKCTSRRAQSACTVAYNTERECQQRGGPVLSAVF